MDLTDKVALVTGAGSGIGAASAKHMAAAGAKVALVDIDAADLQKIAEDIGGDALVITADVSKEEDMKAAYDQVADAWGRLDVVFANAGINGVWAPLDELKLEEWQK
ncbi:MAG TPA: SDR family NAD(P)-dependent oxidoreductase, partial [Chloroflexota bacterium]|nr:SDR family NAD(P)-dependent oxidoreductase [Chloroflexota bacterium]